MVDNLVRQLWGRQWWNGTQNTHIWSRLYIFKQRYVEINYGIWNFTSPAGFGRWFGYGNYCSSMLLFSGITFCFSMQIFLWHQFTALPCRNSKASYGIKFCFSMQIFRWHQFTALPCRFSKASPLLVCDHWVVVNYRPPKAAILIINNPSVQTGSVLAMGALHGAIVACGHLWISILKYHSCHYVINY